MYMTRDGWARTWYGDQGSVGRWKIEVIETINAYKDIVILRPKSNLNQYLYVSKDATGTLAGWTGGNPYTDSQGQFIRIRYSDKIVPNVVPGTKPTLSWKFLEIVPSTGNNET